MSFSILRETLTATHFKKEVLLQFLKDNPTEIENAIVFMPQNIKMVSWRSAWLIGGIIHKNDKRIIPHINQILKNLPQLPDGHQRELIKILNKMILSEEQEGRLFDCCMTIWEAIHKSPSVRIFAFQFLIKTTKKYPDLKNEIDFLTQEQYTTTLSPGIKKSFYKLISF